MSTEIFPVFTDDPEKAQEVIESAENLLCMVVNKDLADPQIGKLVETFYLFCVDYEGEERLAVAGGLYKQKQERFDKIDPKLTMKCNAVRKWINSGDRNPPVLEKRLDDPLCILIHDDLSDPRVEMLKKAYETIEVKVGGHSRTAIACSYYDPNYVTEAKVLGQWYTTEG